MSLISRRLSGLLGQPHFREVADGLLFPGQSVLTWVEGEDRPLAVFAEVGRPRNPKHLASFHERITSHFRMPLIRLLPSPPEAASYTL
jgi:hypothetical protein